MTTTNAKIIFALGIIIALLGATAMLAALMPAPWPYALVVIGLLIGNIGLYWMGQSLDPGRTW